MKRTRRFLARLTASLLGRRDEARLREDLEGHVALLTDANIGAGMPPAEARRHARLTLGAPDAIVEQYRDEQRLRLFDDLGRTCATPVACSDAVQGSPSSRSSRSAWASVRAPRCSSCSTQCVCATCRSLRPRSSGASKSAVTDRQATSRRATAICRPRSGSSSNGGSKRFPRSLASGAPDSSSSSGRRRREAAGRGDLVSGRFFEMLGVGPWRGRVFTSADDSPDCGSPSAVISHRFWQRELAENPSAIWKPAPRRRAHRHHCGHHARALFRRRSWPRLRHRDSPVR